MVLVGSRVLVTIRDPGPEIMGPGKYGCSIPLNYLGPGTRDPGPGTHRVPNSMAKQSGTRDLGPRVPESCLVPKKDPLEHFYGIFVIKF